MVKIIQKDNPILREVAREVTKEDFGSKKLLKIITNMSNALAVEDDGVALAAPQIGIPLRIFIIAGKILSKKAEADLVFINPKIISASKTKARMEEGCLSVRWSYGTVYRSSKITVGAYDQNGKKFSRSGSGLMAQIFQHEIDHLDGVLFIDKAKNIEEITPPEKTTSKS